VANPMGVQNHLTSDPAIGKGAKSEIDLASANGVAAGINSLAGSTATPTSLALSKSGGSPLVGNAVSSIAANGVQVSAASDAGGMARKSAKDGMGTAALQSTAVSSTGNSAADVGRADDRSMTFMAQELFVKPELVKPEPVLQLVAATAKREEQSIHAAAKATTALDVTASWGAGSGAVGGASSYSAASVQDASALTPAYVAEQVSYWISNDVQSAELKLQGLGDSPVDVRISMVGNEAHVSFRTDEAKARDALENASAHLKEMLQRDGVVLSGVSVGTSGSGGAGGQEPQPRDGRQRAIVVAEAPARTEARVRGLAQTGRALDLFV
jgi:flagellar hook-length control protein FliK